MKIHVLHFAIGSNIKPSKLSDTCTRSRVSRLKILNFTHRLYLYDTWNYQNKRLLNMPKKLQVRFM